MYLLVNGSAGTVAGPWRARLTDGRTHGWTDDDIACAGFVQVPLNVLSSETPTSRDFSIDLRLVRNSAGLLPGANLSTSISYCAFDKWQAAAAASPARSAYVRLRSALQDGSYAVQLSYQDRLLNPFVSSGASSILLDTVTQPCSVNFSATVVSTAVTINAMLGEGERGEAAWIRALTLAQPPTAPHCSRGPAELPPSPCASRSPATPRRRPSPSRSAAVRLPPARPRDRAVALTRVHAAGGCSGSGIASCSGNVTEGVWSLSLVYSDIYGNPSTQCTAPATLRIDTSTNAPVAFSVSPTVRLVSDCGHCV
jgi:hypothetical protein